MSDKEKKEVDRPAPALEPDQGGVPDASNS